MERRLRFTKLRALYAKLPLKVWILGGVSFLILLSYSLIFFIPKSVQFSYADTTCAGQLVVAPRLQKIESADFDVAFGNEVRLGNFTIFSTELCFTPKTMPEAGKYTVAVAPFGGPIARKQLTVDVPAPPNAQASDIVGRTISTEQPLDITLSAPDTLHDYHLEIAEQSADCTYETTALSCDVAPLNLKQGATYQAALTQTYKQTSTLLVEGPLETLDPLILKKAGLKDKQTIYTEPTQFAFTFDHPLAEATVALEKLIDKQPTPIQTTTSLNDNQLVVAFDTLERKTQYRLTLTQVIGTDGRSLPGTKTYNFNTSGGPKVKSVSIGDRGVAPNTVVVVTFDQPLDTTVDASEIAHSSGVASVVSRSGKNKLTFALQGGQDCAAFTLTIAKGVKSGSNHEVSSEAWQFTSRFRCGYSWTIGTSLQGRPIIAHSFGSGSKVILFTGGMHGSEPSGQQTMQAWVEYLRTHGEVIPKGVRVVVVPNTNPDGIAVGSRNNSRNVNIDRNFPTKNWQASIDTVNGTLKKGGGTKPGSEPETAALIALTRKLKPRLEVSFHAQGSLVGANKYADSVKIGTIYADIVGYQTMFYNPEEVMGYSLTGEYEDWMGEELGIPAILIELPSPGGNYLTTQLPALLRMLKV